MENSMQVMCTTLTSMEVAEMVEKDHKNIIRDIKRYSRQIEESNIQIGRLKIEPTSENDKSNAVKNDVVKCNQLKIEPVKAETIDLQEFWTESQYKDGKGQIRPCYNITKKGCEFIAHKCTGRKGTVFTARYINRFHEMEHEITGKRLDTKEKVPNVANCPAPPAKNWYRKNLWKIKPCAVKMYCSEEEFLVFLFEYLNNFFDTLKAKEIYEEQTGNELEKDVDLLDFFPDMGERAQKILDFTYSYKMDK